MTADRCDCEGSGWVDCWSCGGSGEGGTTCCDDLCQSTEDGEECMHGAENSTCDICEGKGGWPCGRHGDDR